MSAPASTTDSEKTEIPGHSLPPAAAPSTRPSLSSVPPPHKAARAIGKRPRMSKFRRFLLAITAATHIPFAIAVVEGTRRWIGLPLWMCWSLSLVLFSLGVWLFLGRAEKIANDEPRSFREVFFFDVPYYVHWSACIWCMIPSIVYGIGEPIVDAIRGLPISPSGGFFLWTYLAGLVVCGYGILIRRWWFVTRRINLPIKNLHPALDGYRIVHLSDLHIGALTPPWWAKRWIDRANEEAPDAIVVTGDLVTSGVAFHESIAELIGSLKAKDGVFCAMGNHDYFGEGEPLISLIRSRGPLVLRNEGVVIQRGQGSQSSSSNDSAALENQKEPQKKCLYIAAIDDTWTKRADLDLALKGQPADVPTILLAHDPDRFPQIAKRKVDIVLSGHTHGGQIAVPFLARWINASKLAHHFHIGIYKDGDATLYVHPGLGTTGPPIRLGVAPAVVVHTLRRA